MTLFETLTTHGDTFRNPHNPTVTLFETLTTHGDTFRRSLALAFVGATVPLLLVDACSHDDEEPSYSPERIFVERERRERPPRRYDKHGEDTAKSED